MADERSLMRPLRSDSLKPRPSTQAVWEPGKAAPAASVPPETPEPEPEPEMFADEFIPEGAPPLRDMLHTFAPEIRFDPRPLKEEEESAPGTETAPAASEKIEEPFDLDAVIAAILTEDDDDEDEEAAAQDALPTDRMPRPAFVPLTETPAPKRKKKGWLWLMLILLLALGVGAAWYFGLLPL